MARSKQYSGFTAANGQPTDRQGNPYTLHQWLEQKPKRDPWSPYRVTKGEVTAASNALGLEQAGNAGKK